MKPYFANGDSSWIETHHEVVSSIEEARTRGTTTPKLIQQIQDNYGTCGFYDLAIDITNKFERLNSGREWDGEFWEEIGMFCEKWFNEIEFMDTPDQPW